MDDLFLAPDGDLGVGSADRMDTVGFWIPSAEGEALDLTNVTCRFAADSPIHPDETIRFDCSFTPATDNEPASLTFTSEEGSGVYVWYEAPGRD